MWVVTVYCFRSEAPFILRSQPVPSVANVNLSNHRFFIIPYPFVLSNTPLCAVASPNIQLETALMSTRHKHTKYRSSYTATAARGFADRLRFGKESIYFLHLFLKGFKRGSATALSQGVSGEVNLSVAFINLAITLNLTNTDNTKSSQKITGRVFKTARPVCRHRQAAAETATTTDLRV